jgi:Protein of unknown function (DUF2802)
MNFDVLTHFNWRDVLIVIVALLSIYVLVVFLRMRLIKHEKEVGSAAAQSAVAAYAAARDPTFSTDRRPAPEFAWNEPPPETPNQQVTERLEREVMHLRSEVMHLRGEVGRLRGELSEARDEFRRELTQDRSVQNVAPVYSEAMEMAMQGHDAQTISEHCGVARAEAELVVALVRSR